jgi:hypothetical protein
MNEAGAVYKPTVSAKSEPTSWTCVSDGSVLRVRARKIPGLIAIAVLLAICALLFFIPISGMRQPNGTFTVGPVDVVFIAKVALLAVGGGLAIFWSQRAESRKAESFTLDRATRRISLPKLGIECADRDVQRIQLAKFRVAATFQGAFRIQWFRHLVLVVQQPGTAPSFYPILTYGYGLGRVGRSIASELGVPFEIVRLGAVTP